MTGPMWYGLSVVALAGVLVGWATRNFVERRNDLKIDFAVTLNDEQTALFLKTGEHLIERTFPVHIRILVKLVR